MNWNGLELPNNPYYQDDAVLIYHADCRDILSELGEVYMTITDPPWPSCKVTLPHGDPISLFAEVSKQVINLSPRLGVILGCDSDPRMLKFITDKLPFFVCCWMSRTPPTPKGYKWYSADVVYVFGEGFRNDTRNTLMSSEIKCHSAGHRLNSHPAPRNKIAMLRFVGCYSKTGDIILDPFLGSGTTSLACKSLNRKCIGIEIEEKYCEIAAKRCSQSVMRLEG